MDHFSFTKIVVGDLDASAAFYAQTFGLEESFRVSAAIADRPMEEIVFAATGEGAGTLILLTFTDGAPAPAGVIPGFVTDDVDAVFARGIAAGGSVAQEPRDLPEHAHRVGFLADPEGRIIEVAQPIVVQTDVH
ncbi:MAG: glyoxalase/bleomycin resistance/dioxygenase family protein [Actinobacteria bacterium]|nr:glyoxalase/bleomycin resistance/dioxygenase family protein [Actinomycetota bacterium]